MSEELKIEKGFAPPNKFRRPINPDHREVFHKMVVGDSVLFDTYKDAKSFINYARTAIQNESKNNLMMQMKNIYQKGNGFANPKYRVWLLDREKVAEIKAAIARNLSA